MLNMTDFDLSTRLFRNTGSLEALRLMNSVAREVARVQSEREATPFLAVEDAPRVVLSDFQEVRATFDRALTEDELSRASGAIGYALRIYMAGEELSEPMVKSAAGAPHVAVYAYDATKARRSEPNPVEALAEAVRFIAEGSPVRKSDRAGLGTKGTRLVAGLGKIGVTFAIR